MGIPHQRSHFAVRLFNVLSWNIRQMKRGYPVEEGQMLPDEAWFGEAASGLPLMRLSLVRWKNPDEEAAYDDYELSILSTKDDVLFTLKDASVGGACPVPDTRSLLTAFGEADGHIAAQAFKLVGEAMIWLAQWLERKAEQEEEEQGEETA